MNNLFLGMLFIFLDFNLSLNGHKVGLLPDFVGYILMMKGLEELASQSGHFTRSRPWALGMAIYTGVLYAMDLFAVSVQASFVTWLMGVGAMVVSLMISYWIILGIQEMEKAHFWDLQGMKLKNLWMALAAVQGICQITAWVPLVGVIGILAALIIGICFLVAFHNTKNLYLQFAGQTE